jgi:hypothetical protein
MFQSYCSARKRLSHPELSRKREISDHRIPKFEMTPIGLWHCTKPFNWLLTGGYFNSFIIALFGGLHTLPGSRRTGFRVTRFTGFRGKSTLFLLIRTTPLLRTTGTELLAYVILCPVCYVASRRYVAAPGRTGTIGQCKQRDKCGQHYDQR